MKKLRNKETGEIGSLGFSKEHDVFIVRLERRGKISMSDTAFYQYDSLDKLAEEWEDYEERKQYWFIRHDGDVSSFYDGEFKNDKYISTLQEDLATVGNIFETKEEAEQAVEKLKAWKRIKNSGIELTGWSREGDTIYVEVVDEGGDLSIDDLDICFGGEE